MLKSYLESSGCTVVVNALDGAGFATNLPNTVNAMLTNTSNKNTFTDIIIALGFNDSGFLSKATSDTVINGIKSAMTNIKNNFTKINNLYVFGIGFTSLVDSSIFRTLYNMTYNELYKSHSSNACNFNLHYYSDMYLTFSRGGSLLFRDGVHLTDSGSMLLALNMYGCIMSGENPKYIYSYADESISVSAYPTHSNAVTGVSGTIIEQVRDGMVTVSGSINWTNGSSSGITITSETIIFAGIYERRAIRPDDAGGMKNKVVGYLKTKTNLGDISTPCMIAFCKYNDTHNMVVVVPIILAEHEGTTINGAGKIIIPTMTVPI